MRNWPNTLNSNVEKAQFDIAMPQTGGVGITKKTTFVRQSTEWVPIHQHVGTVVFQFSWELFIICEKQLGTI